METFFLTSEENYLSALGSRSLLQRWMGGCTLFDRHIFGRGLGPVLFALPLLILLPLLVQFLLPFLEAVIALGHGGRSLKMTAEPFQGRQCSTGFTGVLQLSHP